MNEDFMPEAEPAYERPDGIKPGDELCYIPDECHALIKNRLTGQYPWVIGKKKRTNVRGKIVEQVEELSGTATDAFLAGIRKLQTNKEEAMSQVVFLRPNGHWKATVRNVNEDGTVDVDIADPRNGSTLHCDGVKIDNNKAAHTCHLPE